MHRRDLDRLLDEYPLMTVWGVLVVCPSLIMAMATILQVRF